MRPEREGLAVLHRRARHQVRRCQGRESLRGLARHHPRRHTKDAMSATIEEIPYEILHKITYRITHEVEGINRVLMDLTPKPIGTIEWE